MPERATRSCSYRPSSPAPGREADGVRKLVDSLSLHNVELLGWTRAPNAQPPGERDHEAILGRIDSRSAFRSLGPCARVRWLLLAAGSHLARSSSNLSFENAGRPHRSASDTARPIAAGRSSNYGRSTRRAVQRASTSKSLSACNTGTSTRMATAAMRQSISFRTVSPRRRHVR